MQLMNFVMSVLPNAGSGSVSRFGTSLRLGILKSPKAVLALLTVLLLGVRTATESKLFGFWQAPY